MKNLKKYLQQQFSRQVLVPELQLLLRRGSAKVLFLLHVNAPVVMHFVLILNKRCRSKLLLCFYLRQN